MIGTAVALLLTAVGVGLARGPAPAATRLRLLAATSGRARMPRWRFPAGRTGIAVPAACGAVGMAAWSRFGFGVALPVLPAAAGGIAAATATLALSRIAVDRRRSRAAGAVVESVGALAADLRAGQPPAEALAVLAADPRSAPATRHRAVAAVWTVSDSSGAPAAAVLDRVEQDLRDRENQRREIAAQLAGPRSTAALLAGLPVLGMGLGAGMGAEPLRVLLGQPRGQVALLAGVGLEALGVLWTAHIVAKAQDGP